jgi:hypothetical protein
MKNKVLIYEDRNSATAFEKSVIDTAERCNSLIETFENFQDWKKITTLQDWLELVDNPKDYFDKILIASVNLSTGGRQADPSILASLVQIDRESYLNLTAGMPVSEGCKPCQKMKLKKGKSAITLSHYQQFENYLIFNSGFTINEETIATKLEGFKTFADTPARIEIVTFWTNLVKTLNQYHDRYHITDEDKRLIGKSLKLQLSQGTAGNFIINNQTLSYEIQNIKS